MKTKHTQPIILAVLWLMSNAILLWSPSAWGWLRLPTAVLLTFGLPGWAWLPVIRWLDTHQAIERLILLIGGSSLLTAFVLFVAQQLMTPFTEPVVFVALNLTIVSGLMAQLVRPSSPEIARPSWSWPSRRSLLILMGLMGIALFTRSMRLGYAEFHEDELENMRLIVRAYKGESYAAFLDSKGPIHWLLPAALWYLNGWLNEGLARLPFVITSLTLIPLMYVLGRRMSEGQDSIGLIAAGIVSLNGFFVAYARHVENQSLIVFWGALAMWLAYRAYREKRPDFLPYIAFSLAIGLIAHPDVLLYLPVFGFMLVASWGAAGVTWRTDTLPLIGAVLLFMALVASFYVPYLTDPQIGLVYQYFAGERIGQSLFYNRVDNLLEQDRFYSTRFYAPILIALLTWLLGRTFAQAGKLTTAIFLLLSLMIISTVARPEWWLVNPVNVAFLPYALLTLAVLLLPTATFELKILSLWLSAPLGGLLFLAKDAADHVQIAYTAWALLAAFGLMNLWRAIESPSTNQAGVTQNRRDSQIKSVETDFDKLSPHNANNESQVEPVETDSDKRSLRNVNHGFWRRTAQLSLVGLLMACSLVIVAYQQLTFGQTVTAYWQAKRAAEANPHSLYNWLYGGLQRPRKLFSNPRLGGWKAVGYLHETGVMPGDFRSIQESFAVPIWYTFQTPRSCYQDPQHYWLRRDIHDWPDEEKTVMAQGYQLTRIILVDQQPKLHLYEKTTTLTEPQVIDSEAYRHRFDLLATPARFAAGEAIQTNTSFNFGDNLLLRGYTLTDKPVQAGQIVPVTIFWQALAPMTVRYRAFVHLVDGTGRRVAQHDDDPACRLLTTDMRAGQESSRQFRLPLQADTPPGRYELILGVYHPDSLARLPIWDNTSSQNVGDFLTLGSVDIQP